MKTYE
jgi:hypothetical protein